MSLNENHCIKLQATMLPPAFDNEIDANLTTYNRGVIRTNLCQLSEINEWVYSFASISNTKWNVHKSNQNCSAIICSKQYVCHHSAYRKVDREANKRGLSKNTGCNARLKIKIKKRTAKTRRTDPYIKKGLCAVVTIDLVHNHTLHSTEAYYFLPTAPEIKSQFLEYFSSDMTISQAIKYHEGRLELEGKTNEDLENSRINPTYRTVQFWYDKWRNHNFGPRSGAGIFNLSLTFTTYLGKLSEKNKTKNVYAEERILVEFMKNPFAVVVSSPLMKCSQNLLTAKGIVFWDSTSYL